MDNAAHMFSLMETHNAHCCQKGSMKDTFEKST